MNLAEIRSFVSNVTNETVTTPAYRTQLDEAINVAYNEVWLAKPWVFTIKTAQVKLFRDITPDMDTTVAGLDIDVDVSVMSRSLLFSQIVRSLGDEFFRNTYEGQLIEIQGRDYGIVNSHNNATTTGMRIAQPYRSDGSNGTSGESLANYTGWTIKHPIYRLPEDCVELLSWQHLDTPIVSSNVYAADIGPVVSNDLCPHKIDYGADKAEVIYRAPDLVIPPGMKIGLNPFNSTDADAIPDGTYVEFAWSFYYAGTYGPLSASTGVHKLGAGAGNYNTVVIDCLDYNGEFVEVPTRGQPLDTPFPMRYEGLRKVLWFNANLDQTQTIGTNGTTLSETQASRVRAGLPCWKMVTSFDPAGTQVEYRPVIAADDDHNLGVSYLGQLLSSERSGLIIGTEPIEIERRYLPHVTQQVRPYPRITSADIVYPYDEPTTDYEAPTVGFKEATIKYISKPYPLCMAQDTPAMPNEFHYLIAYKVLENWFNKMKEMDSAAYYSAKYEKELQGLSARYLNPRRASSNSRSWAYGSRRNSWQMSGRVTYE